MVFSRSMKAVAVATSGPPPMAKKCASSRAVCRRTRSTSLIDRRPWSGVSSMPKARATVAVVDAVMNRRRSTVASFGATGGRRGGAGRFVLAFPLGTNPIAWAGRPKRCSSASRY
ncbi:hypothetical protein [Streptomyces melanogenes]|uniref:hypothetical protein n=1 Tax=Streptomyces melanogenes TaxID=67326 RepID=UPI0037915DDA